MTIRRTVMLAAILALASGQAALPQTAAKPGAAPPPPDPCAPSQYAKDDYFPAPAKVSTLNGSVRAGRGARVCPGNAGVGK